MVLLHFIEGAARQKEMSAMSRLEENTNFQIAAAMMIERNMMRRCAMKKYWVLKIRQQVTRVTWPN
jgi:hypothetical protein